MGFTAFERAVVDEQTIDRALSGAKQVPYWLDDVHRAVTPELIGASAADLAVVGGGYLGLWSAVLYKREHPDASVVLLEAHTVGWAASGRNGGFCEASLTHGYDNGKSRWPDEMETLERLSAENLDEIERDIHDLGIECEFERPGSLSVAVEDYQVEALREAANGDDAILLEGEALEAQVRSPLYKAALWSKKEGALVHPAKLAFELARVATALGVTLHENSLVESLSEQRADGTITLFTPRGTVTARQVVLATNVFPSLVRSTRLLTVPVYDYVLMTEPLSVAQSEAIGWQHRQGIGDVSNQFHYYRKTADDRILWGGYDAIYHFGREVKAEYEVRPATFRKLAHNFFATFPQLEGIKFTHQWAGAIDTCSRFCAYFGTAHHGKVFYAAGFTGLGVAATHFAAKVLGDQLEGRSTERTELTMVKTKPFPFPPEPLASAAIQATRHSLIRADRNDGKRNLLLKTLDSLGLGFDS